MNARAAADRDGAGRRGSAGGRVASQARAASASPSRYPSARAHASAGASILAPALALSVQLGPGITELPVSRSRLRRWCRLALAGPSRIVLRLVGTGEGRALNRRYRGRDHATNVLTFDYTHDAETIADIVLCVPVIRREAKQAGRPFDAHLAHLVIHGLLHAQGYDHEPDAAARTMELREVELLRRPRIHDPYRCRAPGAVDDDRPALAR